MPQLVPTPHQKAVNRLQMQRLGLPFSLFGSLVLHIGIGTLLLIGMPNRQYKSSDNKEYTIVIDAVPISQITNIKVKSASTQPVPQPAIQDNQDSSVNPKEEPMPAPEPEEKKTSEINQTEEVKTPVKNQTPIPEKEGVAQKKEEVSSSEKIKTPEPDPHLDKVQISEKKTQLPKENKNPENKAKISPKPIKQQIKEPVENKKENKSSNKKTEKNKALDVDALLKSLESGDKKKIPSPLNPSNKKKGSTTPVAASTTGMEGRTNIPYDDDLPLSISEVSAIRSAIEKNWYNKGFAGSTNDLDMVVELIIYLDTEANVISVKMGKSFGRNMADPVYKAFVESTIRATYAASPFSILPKDKYKDWNELHLTFSPGNANY